MWGKGEGGRSEFDKADVGSEWLGESRIEVVIGSIGWGIEGKESLEISKEGNIWGKVMVEWGEEEYVEEIKGKTISWKRKSLETKIFLVAKLSTLKPLTP